MVVRLIGSHRILHEPLENEPRERADAWRSASLASIQEDIQRRIASDLHDSTCQHLIAASLGLMRVRAYLADPIDAGWLCDNIDASIDEALKEIRSFSYLLHPQNLAIEGLKATIERYAAGFAARTSLRVSTRILADVNRLPRDSQYALLRVTQEALTNVFRHAKASEVKIVIDATNDQFRLRIGDNGRGFPVGDVRRGAKAGSAGVGIPAMRARLEQLGGALDIQFNTAMHRSGTLLCAFVPRGVAMKRRNCRSRTDTVAAYRGPH
jgi:signal transduction histidine kinase